MNSEVVIIFTFGMLFYHGAVSESSGRTTRVLSVLSVVFVYHKLFTRSLDIRSFIEEIPRKNKAVFGSVFLFIGLLVSLETLIMAMVSRFLPSTFVTVLERAGGVCVTLGLLLLFSSIWILSMTPDINSCLFIDQGVYAYLRHPYYLSIMLLFIGCSLTLLNTVSIGIAYYILKDRVVELIRSEEAFIEQQHKSYSNYKRRVYSGFPFIWQTCEPAKEVLESAEEE